MSSQRNLHKNKDSSSLTLAAVALQDHWSRSLHLGSSLGPRNIGLGRAAKAKQRKIIKPVVDCGRKQEPKKSSILPTKEKEYVLDVEPAPLSLAQKLGFVEAPKPLLTEQEWKGVKDQSNNRDDSKDPCVICKEDFGLQEQVLLSCSHVFHRACLQAFERFTGRKTCPMCRHEQYQTRVIHEGARMHRHKSATLIQAAWRGYVVKSWYRNLRETVPPKDPMLKKRFYEEKLSSIVDRMIRSMDVRVSEFMRELDDSVQRSRAVFSQWDSLHTEITLEEWDAIQLKAVERGDKDCPICLTELYLKSSEDNSVKNTIKNKPNDDKNGKSSQKLQNKTSTYSRFQMDKHQQKNDTKLLEFLGQQKMIQDSRTMHGECDSGNLINKTESNEKNCDVSTKFVRSTVLTSCTHVFHFACLQTLEDLAMFDMKNSCPVCRSHYQKKVISV